MATFEASDWVVAGVFLSFWPGMPLALMLWGWVNAQSAQKVIDSLTGTTTGVVTRSSASETRSEHYDEALEFRVKIAIHFDYVVDGTSYTGGSFAPPGNMPASELRAGLDATVAKYTVGQSYPAFYDPAHPSRAYLVKGSKWDHAGKLKWGLYILAGVFGLLAMLLTLSKYS